MWRHRSSAIVFSASQCCGQADAPEGHRGDSHTDLQCASGRSTTRKKITGTAMILRSASIKNFRSIKDLKVDFRNQTAILGSNGSGKSSILKAIDKFYSSSSGIELDDFFGKNPEAPIEIGLTFRDLTASETQLFAGRIHNDELSVVRVFEAGLEKGNGRYFGFKLQCPAFTEVRDASGATDKRRAYDALRSNDQFNALQAVKAAGEIEAHLQDWEASHQAECQISRDDGQFFGFTNVAQGKLQRATSFVFIPAVRDALADSQDARGAVVAKLMELVVRNAVQRRPAFKKWQEQIAKEYSEHTSPDAMPELAELSGVLSKTLKVFYNEAGVDLRWKDAPEFSVPLPVADMLLDDDGFAGPVDRKGHGLQRALVLTLLQHLAKASQPTAVIEGEAAPQSEAEAEEAGWKPPPPLPGLILAIEEPELYQHPTKQRHFARILTELSSNGLEGVAAQMQVIFASHSSYFISMDRFEEIRIARKRAIEGLKFKECVLDAATLEDVNTLNESAFEKPRGTWKASDLSGKLHVLSPDISEGFFADLVVLVEGVSDRAALVGVAQALGLDFEANGIAVVVAGGKDNVDKVAPVFQVFNIPTFILWDCDSPVQNEPKKEAQRVAQNFALQRRAGVKGQLVTDSTNIGEKHACFAVDLESTLSSEFGDAAYQEELKNAREQFELQKNDPQKSPYAMTSIVSNLQAKSLSSPTLEGIVRQIFELRRQGKA